MVDNRIIGIVVVKGTTEEAPDDGTVDAGTTLGPA